MNNHTDILTSLSWWDGAGRVRHSIGRLRGFRSPTSVVISVCVSPDEEPVTLEIELGEKDLEALRDAVTNRLRETRR